MFHFVYALAKRRYLLLLALALLCGCGFLPASQTSSTPTTGAQEPSPMSTPTTAAQTAFPSYVGKWQVHDGLLAINADQTGLLQWNAGPCGADQMCNGNAHLMFAEQANGSILGTIQSVSYSQWNGDPAPTGYQPSADDPQAGETFQLQHSGTHLLYTTWLGQASALNTNNRYWCDAYAVSAGWSQCGA